MIADGRNPPAHRLGGFENRRLCGDGDGITVDVKSDISHRKLRWSIGVRE
jgi:hypothetical protein